MRQRFMPRRVKPGVTCTMGAGRLLSLVEGLTSNRRMAVPPWRRSCTIQRRIPTRGPVMLTQVQPVVPPAPKVHDRDLPGWRALYKFNRNTLSSQPQRAFEEPIIRRRMLGLESLLINDPDGVRHVLASAMDKYKRLVAADRILGPLGGTGLFL